jgi:hypothetical protein
MARRHNEYARILGTVENGSSGGYDMGADGGSIPMKGVPDMGNIAESIEHHAQSLHRHAHHLRALAEAQPSWNDTVGEVTPLDIGSTAWEDSGAWGGDIGLPEDTY